MTRGRPLHVDVILVAVFCVAILASSGVARGQPQLTEGERAVPGRAGWLAESRTGCRVWRQFPRTGDVVSWTGACDSGRRATGYGIAEWRAPDAIERYEGDFLAGKPHGRGVYDEAGGGRYEGEFADGKPHGRGLYTDATGNRYEGYFENGDWIGDDWEVGARHAQKAGDERRYAEAERLWRAAIETAEEPGADWGRLFRGLRGLSDVYSAQARHAEAEPLLRRGLALCERHLAPDAAELRWCLAPLAFNQVERQGLVEAESLFARALSIVEQTLGAEHEDAGAILNGLAETHRLAGRYREAEAHQGRSLSIRERALGAEHVLVAQSLNNLALVYTAQQREAEAKPLFERAIAIYDKALGSFHPSPATVRANLGELLAGQGRSREAEPLLKRSLEIRERVLPPGDPAVETSLTLLGQLHFNEAHYADAAPLVERATALRERRLGAEHPEVAASLAALARVVRGQGRLQDAEVLQRRALAIVENDARSREDAVANLLYELAETALAQAKTDEADDLLRRAATIRHARGETTATAALQVLANRHIARPDPARLAEAALAEVQRMLASRGVHDASGAPSGQDPAHELKGGLDRAARLVQGQLGGDALQRAAVQAMVRALGDPHTRWVDPDTGRRLGMLAAGKRLYVGAGVESVVVGGRDYVRHVVPGGPAALAGVQAFDRILGISGASIAALSTRERLSRGQTIALTVQSANEPRSRIVTIVSDLVSVPAVEHRFARPGIGHIRLNHFGVGTGTALRDALADLRRQGLAGLIVDLRHNGGGLTRELIPAAETMVPAGTLLLELETRRGHRVRVTRAAPILPTSIPLAVLVDKGTASTAEMLAAAIRATGRGVVVGSQTAGAVAEKDFVWLPGGDGLLVRTSRVRSSGGLALDGVGMVPNIVQELVAVDLDRGVDSQLERAVQEVARRRQALELR